MSRILTSLLLLMFYFNAFAGYEIEFRITQMCVGNGTTSHDCDGWPNGDSDFMYELRVWDPSNLLGIGSWETASREYGDNNGPYCRADITTGAGWVNFPQNIDLEYRMLDNDLVGSDANTDWQNVNICGLVDPTLTDNTWRNLTTVNRTVSDGDCSNGGSIRYSMTFQYRIRTSGSTPSNDNICNAINRGTLAAGGSFTQSGMTNKGATSEDYCGVNEPNATGDDETIWLKFATDANPGTKIDVNVNASNGEGGACVFGVTTAGWLRIYEGPETLTCDNTNTRFTQLSGSVGSNNDPTTITQDNWRIDCPKPSQWYYVQIETGGLSTCDLADFSLSVSMDAAQKGPDFICEPYTSTTPSTGGFLGTLSSSNNTPLVLNNQSTRCATSNGFEPDNTTILSGLNNTVWYRFTTPPADYPDNTLFHLYDVLIERRSSSSAVTYPALYLYKETATTNRACGNTSGDYNNLQFIGRDEIDPLNIFNGGTAQLTDLCLAPNTNYYIQVDPVGGIPFVDSYLDFNVRVRKSAFRPADEICAATSIPTSVVSGLNKTTTVSNAPFNAAPYFGLPHTNKCKSSTSGEPNISPGGPGSGSHSASVWYSFTTDANPAEWIEWDHNDFNVRGDRGGACVLGALWNSRVFIYESSNGGCAYPSLVPQSEFNMPGDIPFLASIDPGKFRLRCPLPNTTYYVQVYDAEAFSVSPSTCYEGLWNPTIKTAPTTSGIPTNDDPCGAIFLGTVPVSGTLAPNTVYNNFCATPTKGFIPDRTQPLERDVWFSFIAPPSGSVLITGQSAPSGSPTNVDDDIDLQMAIWEPILGDANATPHCSDPRYLWTPIVSRDHDVIDYADVPQVSLSYYDIIDTRNNVLNEGNSLIATCLNPGKLYYIQVDGGEYLACDLFDGGNCVMGFFKLQVKDAGLYDMASMQTLPQGNDEPCGGPFLPVNNPGTSYGSLQWRVGSNLCATAINDPLPSTWNSSDNTVWYKFVAPASGKVRIRAERISQLNRRDKVNPNSPSGLLSTSDPDYHEEMNLQLAVFEMAPSCFNKASLVEVASSYDGLLVENNPLNTDDYVELATSGFDEYMVAKCLEPGKTYYIMVDGENDPTLGLPGFTADIEDVVGDFRISVQDFATVPASVNDDICDAFEITAVQGLALNASTQTGLFNNECASIEPAIEGPGKIAFEMEGPLFNVDAKRTLWFKFRAPSSGKVRIEAINSGNDYIDLAMALYDVPGQNCSNATGMFTVDEDYDPAIDPLDPFDLRDENVEIECLVPGRMYFLQVDGSGNFASCIPSSLCETGEFRIRVTHLPADPRSDVLPQKNDNFCDAINLGNLNPGGNFSRNNHNNRCSTEEINEPGGSGWNFTLFDDQERTVWYRFKTGGAIGPLAPGPVTITATDPNPDPCFDIDLELFEYSGTFNTTSCNTAANSNNQFNSLLKVGKGQPLSIIPLTDDNRSESITLDCPKPDKEYFVRITGSTTCPGFGATMGEFDLNVSMSGISIMARENDDLCEATNSAAGNLGTLATGATLQRLNHNNLCATQELVEPNTTQSAVQSEPEYDETMWYRFRTSSTPGEIKVRLDAVLPAGFFSVPSLTVYKGSNASYNPCTQGFGGLIEVGTDIGQVNAIQILKDYAEVTLPCPSANWFYFIQVDGADLSLFGLTPPGYTDNFTYNVTVTDDGSGSIRPINDKVTGSIPVDSIAPLDGILTVGGTLAIKGQNNCATADDNEPRFSDIVNAQYNGSNTTDHQSSLEDETVWFYFITPDKPGIIGVRVQDDPAFPESFSPNFAIYYNDGTGPTFRLTQAPSSNLIQEGAEATSVAGTNAYREYTCLLPSTQYWIQVDGNDGVPGRVDQGNFIVTVTDDGTGSPGPNNDLICNAENLTAGLAQNATATWNRTNLCSWEEMGEPNTSDNMSGTGDDVTSNNYDETVWFRFRPNWEGNFRIQVTNTHNFILYRSTSATYDCTNPVWNNLTRMSTSLGSDDETFSCLDNGVWYYLQVDGDDGIGPDVGPFTLNITHSDATILSHDMFCSALNLGTINGTTIASTLQNNACATQELNEPGTDGNYYDINSLGYDKTLWYRFRTPATTGEWTISVTNDAPVTDRISATFNLYQLTGTACTSGNPNWSNINNIQGSGIANITTGNNSVTLECFRLSTNTDYYIQVHGEDLGPFGEVGTNFTLSVTHNPEVAGSNDNVCTPQLLTVGGAAYADNNICAGTQTGEPDISPVPQNSNTSGYDETMWYRFVAPAQGYVKIEGRSQASNPVDLNMTLYELPSGVTSICAGGVPSWSLLKKVGEADNLISYDFDYENQCLAPGRSYMLKIDGTDLIDDRGNYTIRIINEHVAQGVTCNVQNDEPCSLPPAFDLTPFVRDNKCTSAGQFYPTNYQIYDGSPDVDCATRSPIGSPCGSRTNCSDYWFQFTVPFDSDGGVKIQGEDEY